MTKDEAQKVAHDWVAAWNAHDLDLIMAHYDDAVELTSPVAAQLLGIPEGKVVGKTAGCVRLRGLLPVQASCASHRQTSHLQGSECNGR